MKLFAAVLILAAAIYLYHLLEIWEIKYQKKQDKLNKKK
jgi:hypothetical protein